MKVVACVLLLRRSCRHDTQCNIGRAPARVDMTNLEEPPDPTKPHASGIRWWLLIIASCIAGGQGGIWIIYSVTAEAVEPIYNWNQQTIALLSLWGPLLFLVGCVPSMWLLDVGGLRLTAIVTSFVVFAGSVARIVHRGGMKPRCLRILAKY